MPVRIEKIPGTAFFAFPEMKNLLISELSSRFSYNPAEHGSKEFGDLLYCPDFAPQKDPSGQNLLPYWAATSLLEPFKMSFDSIGDAAKGLSQIQRNWAGGHYQFFRRAELIQKKLPYIKLKKRNFPFEIPDSPMGFYTLTGENEILASAATSSALPCGILTFEEDHVNPPSRAYLKIQESLTLARQFFGVDLPSENSKCFEAGACPGGWTWVLRQLGAEVFAVDRAPLADSLMSDPKVKFLAHDAFTLKPQEIGECDWVFSDVICYPERLLEWVKVWLDSGLTKKMICTIKMQGAIDWSIVAKFAQIPNSKVVHLHYNKHELTWIHCE